jgi:hypothetical protein
VYVPANLYGDQSKIEAQIATSFAAAFMLGNPDNGCLESLQKGMCASVYTRCDTAVLARSRISALPIAFPRLPCQDLCQTVRQQCGTLLANSASVAALFNCNGTGLTLAPTPTCNGKFKGVGGANFPTSSSLLATVSVGGQAVPLSSSCNEFVSIYPTNASSVVTCPWFLAPRASPQDQGILFEGSCATPCPNFLATKAERADSDKFFTALTIISFITSAFTWVTWLIFPVKRKQRVTLCFTTCVFMLSDSRKHPAICTPKRKRHRRWSSFKLTFPSRVFLLHAVCLA